MKILWSANANHVPSGYGVQSLHITEGLRALGHEVALAPTYGIQGGAVEMGGMRVYSPWRDKVGQDVLPAHAEHFGADLIVTLYDLWPFGVDFAARLKRPWAPWFPQDSYPPCQSVVERARSADYPIAISKFGVGSMAEQGVDCHYIPHGCSVDVYKPLDKAECRKAIGIPADKFVVLMVAANQSFPSRKAFPECLAAFSEFHKAHPDSLLYLHTTMKPRGQAWDGVELDLLIKALGLQDCVIFAKEYTLILGLPDTEMAKVYNSADVLLSASMGEGFGVPIIEAQACGTPAITTNFSSMPELTFNGIAVEPVQLSYTALNTWQAVPSIHGITDALESIYQTSSADKGTHAQIGRQAIVQNYSWPVVMDAWREFLAQVESGDKPTQERLSHYSINGVEIDVWDDKLSFTTGCVASELAADTYKLESIDFQPGDIVLDIGGHVGLFALYVAKRWPGVRVISYEPSATNFERFARNLELAGVENVEAINQAVTADGRDVQLVLDRGNTGGTTEFVKPNGHLKESAISTTLDKILDGLREPFVGSPDVRIKLLKIDAEGAEYEVLTTARCLDRVDYLSGEFHSNSILEAQGYSIAGLAQHCKQFLAPSRVTYTSCQMGE